MKRAVFTFIFSAVSVVCCMAQAGIDALVVEWKNGLADIFQVSESLYIDNDTERDSVFVLEGKNIQAAYARADISRIAFDDYTTLTDSVTRAALVALYNATDGDHWTNNTNWCTDEPITSWYGIGVNINSIGQTVNRLNLPNNNLTGHLPVELCNLKQLQQMLLGSNKLSGILPEGLERLSEMYSLHLYNNSLSGEIPPELGNLTKLTGLYLHNNQLTGTIPPELGNLSILTGLNLSNNKLSGEIPPELGNLSILTGLYLSGNKLSGVIPPELGKLARLAALLLSHNSLSGDIPSVLGKLPLVSLYLNSNALSGEIPPELGNLSMLTRLDVSYNQLSGEIPPELGNLTELTELKLSSNQLSGEIPESFNNLKGLITDDGNYKLSTYENNLSGAIPAFFYDHPSWRDEWIWLLFQSRLYSLEDLYIPAPPFHVTDIDGQILDSKDIYPKNKYTAILHWNTWCAFSNGLIPEVITLYEKYHDDGFDVVGLIHEKENTEQAIRKTIQDKHIGWPNFISSPQNKLDYYSSFTGYSSSAGYPAGAAPEITLVDSTGRVVFYDQINNRADLAAFLEARMGQGSHVDVYSSTDFSADGAVQTLQQASTEDDIKVVIMGDGFSDRQIADGTYDSVMDKTMEALFSIEPVKSLRDRFTVKSVTAVSTNEIFSDSTVTALDCFNDASGLGGDAHKVFLYAQKAIDQTEIDDAVIVVVLNSELAVGSSEAGICYMYQPSSHGSCGSGASISFVPNMTGNGGAFDDISFETVLVHEAIGHGLTKLGDEYVTVEEEITLERKTGYQTEMEQGWWKNIDFNSSADTVKWKEFITDSRYDAEAIGIYEGGLTYRWGVYRSTQTSLMGSNGATFNAPCREAIWYRINSLTQGDDWRGTHADFVAFDQLPLHSNAKARSVTGSSNQSVILHEYKGAPPVVMRHSWREAVPSGQSKEN